MKSVYIHIPFCTNICTYCDFSKLFYNEDIVNKYLNALNNEIQKCYKGEKIKTIYIGGGTPSSLSTSQLEQIFKILKIFNITKNCEFTVECNPENMNEEKVKLFEEYGVNRVSIGVQSFNNKILNTLGRNHTNEQVYHLIKQLKKHNIYNINIDLIFGVKDQTLKDIKYDLDKFLNLQIPHISYYSLILEKNTNLYINHYEEIDDDYCAEMYDYICDYLKNNNYNHYEISNFSKKNYESRHNLTYWDNEEYYGFGLGSHGFINNNRYENTRSITKYLKGNYKLHENSIDINTNMENELILGLRKLKGINKEDFKNKYHKDIFDVFIFTNLIKYDLILNNHTNLCINPKYMFISNEILAQILSGKG